MPYQVKRVVQADEVPDWERRPPKWAELVDQVMSLEPGQSVEVFFDNPSEGERARNAVRDQANLKARAVVVRTRLVEVEGGATVYLTRVHPTAGSPPQEE